MVLTFAQCTKLNEAITALVQTQVLLIMLLVVCFKWIKATNTKDEDDITVGDYANFQSIVVGGNYISSNADDFQFQWGTNDVQPDTRHLWYASSYTSTGGGRYMSNTS